MIDLFLVDQRIRIQVVDTQMLRSDDLGTDHYQVFVRISGVLAGFFKYL